MVSLMFLQWTYVKLLTYPHKNSILIILKNNTNILYDFQLSRLSFPYSAYKKRKADYFWENTKKG